MNNKPFSYTSHFGTEFTCDKCDFSKPIIVKTNLASSIPPQAILIRDVAEMVGYHATNIHPQLNGFQGYDCLDFEFSKD